MDFSVFYVKLLLLDLPFLAFGFDVFLFVIICCKCF